MGETTALVSWDEEDWATAFEVNYSEVGFQGKSSTIEVRVPPCGINAFENITGLDPGTTYTFKVRAYGDGLTYASVWGDWSDPVEGITGTPSDPSAPTGLTLSREAGDDDDLDLTYTQSGESTHYYQFELHSSDSETDKYTLASTNSVSSASPADFDDVDTGKWYKARGRNCETSSRTVCGSWSGWSNAVEIPSTLPGASACQTDAVIPDWDAESNAGLLNDCKVLLGTIGALKGSATPNLDWSADTLIENWDRVTVGGSAVRRVTGLNLKELGLNGTIPPRLGDLVQLNFLYLNHNDLSGQIPSNLGSLDSVRVIELRNNKLSGEIPSALGSLTNLISLGLSNNKLTGSIPRELGDLEGLRILNLSNNRLAGEIPTELSNLTSLRQVYLSGNRFSGCVPKEVAATLGQASNHDLEQLNITVCYDPVVELQASGESLLDVASCWLVLLTTTDSTSSTVTTPDGVVHKYSVELQTGIGGSADAFAGTYECYYGRVTATSSPAADSINLNMSLVKSFAEWQTFSWEAIEDMQWSEFAQSFTLPPPDRSAPALRSLTHSCTQCQGIIIETGQGVAAPGKFKHYDIYLFGDHTFSSGGAEEDFDTEASFPIIPDLPGSLTELVSAVLAELTTEVNGLTPEEQQQFENWLNENAPVEDE